MSEQLENQPKPQPKPETNPNAGKRAKSVKVGATVTVDGAGVMLRHPDGTVATAGRVVQFVSAGEHAVIATVDGEQVETRYKVTKPESA